MAFLSYYQLNQFGGSGLLDPAFMVSNRMVSLAYGQADHQDSIHYILTKWVISVLLLKLSI